MSCRAAVISVVVGGGGGAVSGNTVLAGRTKCSVGGTAAAIISESCSAVTSPAISAIVLATLIWSWWASARSLNSLYISWQAMGGNGSAGSLLVKAPRMLSVSGTVRSSSTTFAWGSFGSSSWFIRLSSCSWLLSIIFMTACTFALLALPQIVVSACLYVVASLV